MDTRFEPTKVLDSVVIPAKKASGQGVQMHHLMVLLAMVWERDQSVGLLLGIASLPSSLCEG